MVPFRVPTLAARGCRAKDIEQADEVSLEPIAAQKRAPGRFAGVCENILA